MPCGKVVKDPLGIFCTNVCHIRRDNKVCKIVWKPSLYRDHPDDIFDLNKLLDEEGFKWIQVMDQGIFQLARTENSLLTTMKCIICIFLLLTGRR